MNIIHIAGSPRSKSDSFLIAQTFVTAAEALGASAVTYRLNQMTIKGCQGCYACKTGKERCVVKDDLGPVLQEIHGADVLLLSTPVYFWDLPGQMKCFIDRSYSFARDDWQTNPEPSRLPKGKHLVFVQTQAADAGSHTDIFPKYEAIFKFFAGFSAAWLLRAAGISGPGRIPDSVLDEARALAKTVCTMVP